MKERDRRKLPIAASIAGALLVPLAVACGGKGEVQSNKIDNQVPQATASLEIPQTECSPEIEKAIQTLDGIISQIENPEQWVEDLFYSPVLDFIKQNILEPDSSQLGLKDIRNDLLNCNVQGAMEIMTSDIGEEKSYAFIAITGVYDIDPAMQPEPYVSWSEAEIKKYDPKRNFIPENWKSYRLSQAREQAAIDFMALYYYLDSLTGGN